jgi:hypothetical protein
MSGSGIMKGRFAWRWPVFAFFSLSLAPQARWLTVHNDFFQYDLDGNPIRTRSGCLNRFGDTYYWYGCDQAMTNQTCYSSTDLLHWTNHGNMLTASRGSNRMDVLYNESTKKYVMVVKWETPGSEWCNRAIATSDSPTGPFTKQFDSTVYGANTGDMSVFKDDDGKAYFAWEIWDNGKTTQSLALMAPDYISLQKKIQTWPNSDREAEMIMKRRGRYYYLTSKMVGIDPSETQYFTAPAIEGPWTTNLVPVIAPGDADRNSWDTQCDFVYRFKGTEDTVQMYAGDRWKRPHPARSGDYVWLPISFTPKDSVVVNYYQDWEVDPDRGIWRAIDEKRNLALNKTATASSTSGTNVPGNVTAPATWQDYMNTKWVSGAGDPQWITVDLGSSMTVNRVILKWDSTYAKAFQIQVSNDDAAWTDVFSTAKGAARSVTDETFATVTARYVRMNGTARGGTGTGYSLFDFMVLNDSGAIVPIRKPGPSLSAAGVTLSCKNRLVTYTLVSGAEVRVEIADLRGNIVAVLAEGFRPAGAHAAALPASVSGGTYILRLSAGGKTAARKLVRGRLR